jgi:hypothetical protein
MGVCVEREAAMVVAVCVCAWGGHLVGITPVSPSPGESTTLFAEIKNGIPAASAAVKSISTVTFSGRIGVGVRVDVRVNVSVRDLSSKRGSQISPA